MPDKVETVVRYADACRAMANEADHQATQYVWGSSPEARLYRQHAAALRALAALCEEIERGNSDDCSPDEFCNRIAAGYREGR